MPIKVFWYLNKQVDRLRAEEELRQASILAAITSQEGYEKALENLRGQLGEIAVFEPSVTTLNLDAATDEGLDPEFDRAGLMALKARHCAPKKVTKDLLANESD